MTKYSINKIGDINLDLKKDAASNGRSLTDHLEVLASRGEVNPSIIDPNRRNSQGQKVPVYRQMLAAADIDVRGVRSSQTVEEGFHRKEENRILWPAYIEARYREIQSEPTGELSYNDLVVERVPLSAGQTVAQIPMLKDALQDPEQDPSRIAEGSEFPIISLNTGDYIAHLKKFGARLEATREALMGAKLSLFDTWLAQHARRIQRQKTRAALALLKNGDGHDNVAPNIDGKMSIISLVKLRQKAAEFGASPTVITGDAEAFAKLFELPVLTGAASVSPQAVQMMSTGALPNVLGMVPKTAPIPSVLDGSNQLMAIDTTRGLIEFYSPQMDLVEYEYLMKRQVEAVQISESIALGKPDKSVAVTLTLT